MEADKVKANMGGLLLAAVNNKYVEQADEKRKQEIADMYNQPDEEETKPDEDGQLLENSESDNEDHQSQNENYDNEQDDDQKNEKQSSSEPEELTEPMVVDLGPKKSFDPNLYEEKS